MAATALQPKADSLPYFGNDGSAAPMRAQPRTLVETFLQSRFGSGANSCRYIIVAQIDSSAVQGVPNSSFGSDTSAAQVGFTRRR